MTGQTRRQCLLPSKYRSLAAYPPDPTAPMQRGSFSNVVVQLLSLASLSRASGGAILEFEVLARSLKPSTRYFQQARPNIHLWHPLASSGSAAQLQHCIRRATGVMTKLLRPCNEIGRSDQMCLAARQPGCIHQCNIRPARQLLDSAETPSTDALRTAIDALLLGH